MSGPGCQNCAAAAMREHWDFTEGCRTCCARSASRLPQYRRARDTGQQDRAYRRLLEQFGLTHAEVRAAAEADAIERETHE